MNLEQRIKAFIKLGDFIRQFTNNIPQKKENIPFNDLFFDGFKHQLKIAQEQNKWFNTDNLTFALNGWAESLTENNINTWLKPYTFNSNPAKRVAIIMAGNIPLVGFHDFLSVLITGHEVIVKQSSNDKHLLPFLAKYLEYIEPEFKSKILFVDGKLDQFDAVIATGSDNTARYFEYYFKDKPAIIRKNRNSVAVLTGNETTEDLEGLADDIFRYYGLGCRNVSKLYVPKQYDFQNFFQAMYKWKDVINDHKYANNYDYNKAVYLMSEFDMLENGFLMIKEDPSFSSPIATLFYEYYNDVNSLKNELISKKSKIQCIVSKDFTEHEIVFGNTQSPKLWDYADNVDTVAFLLKI
ncbi:acyl-CoA reductase [Formosa sediminum]|uniref:Acyl-CoA reductase n=1 Tax=Formosa sediminum TaxID=2594004 RepID=A0A516GUH6_9FLAO|nr:acyl-CoA reductase [Formosa sediminum]QDO95030.1 acyl-CoA reductase [Formosa sediminum]